MTDSSIQKLINHERLPPSFIEVVTEVYQPICGVIRTSFKDKTAPVVIGINGCPGSGKSTMALFLKALLESNHGLSVEIVSIDDFYKTKQERVQLADQVHPMFITRGVPGTHDVALALDTLEKLANASLENECQIPRFNKASDDRHPNTLWPNVSKAPDFIIFEGWCVAATAQSDDDLKQPINVLEQRDDPNGTWRRYVNTQLAGPYQPLFEKIEYLIVIQPPSPDIVLTWRIEQEEKLRKATRSGHAEKKPPIGMTDDQLFNFVMHYERLIRHMHQTLPSSANILVKLDEARTLTKLLIET